MPKKKTRDELIEEIYKDCGELVIRYIDKAEREMSKIGRLAVWKWYKSYSPIYYNRKRTLYYGFKVTGKNGVLKVHFGPEEMYHVHFVDKINPSYIFENSFMGGFHGGAIDGENHPNPGVPYWRTPPPDYPYWSVPARQDESPYSRIDYAFDDYMMKFRSHLAKDFKRKILPKVIKAKHTF